MRWARDAIDRLSMTTIKKAAAKRRRLGINITGLALMLGMSRNTYYVAMRGNVVSPATRQAIESFARNP